FTIDARHADPTLRDRLYAAHESEIRAVADRRGPEASWEITADQPPCPSDPGLGRLLEEAARAQGIPFKTMPSGAVHDTQRMADIARVAMIFVQSKGGRSHTPAEFTTIDDAVAGIRVLAAALHRLAY